MNAAQSLEEKYQEALRALEEILKIPIENSIVDSTENSLAQGSKGVKINENHEFQNKLNSSDLRVTPDRPRYDFISLKVTPSQKMKRLRNKRQ